MKIEFLDPDLDKLGELADQAHEAGTHWSDVYELTGVEFDQNDNPVGPISCVLYAQENDQDGNLNRDRQPKPALQKGSTNLQHLQVGVTAEGATLIPAQDGVGGDETMLHFVTPKGGDGEKVTLTATITPDGEALKPLIDWEGATEDPEDPLKATVPKDAAAKHVVKIKLDGKVIKEFRVWVVWCSPSSAGGENIEASFDDPRWLQIQLTSARTFSFDIQPATIIDDVDRPKLSGPKTADPPDVPPAEADVWHAGVDLGDGADMHWDESRRMRKKVLNPNGLNLNGYVCNCGCGRPAYVDRLSWPSAPEMGNDDTQPRDEDNNPYDQANHGKLTGTDTPYLRMRHADGAVGNTVEVRWHFQEFARFELGDPPHATWYVISDDFPWRIHAKFKKADEAVDHHDYNNDGDQLDVLWIDDGSSTAADNSGW